MGKFSERLSPHKCHTVMLFPPNWSATVSGPHLAMPLLAGTARDMGCKADVWDLSQKFYSQNSVPPPISLISQACASADFSSLDQLYFAWEDQLRAFGSANGNHDDFGLLSGYSFKNLEKLSLEDVSCALAGGTVYTQFFTERVIPSLQEIDPAIIGLTIASENQIVPAVELLKLIRAELPETFLILGGNVVTRLRRSRAFKLLTSLTDQIVFFQGELAFGQAVRMVRDHGVEEARIRLPRINSDELIPVEQWPVPNFDGIDFGSFVDNPVLPYSSTRGCYWGKCNFCAIPDGWSSTGYAGSSPSEYVVAQIKKMVEQTSIRRVKFTDESLSPAKALAISEQLLASGLHIEWEAYARLESAWEDMACLERMREAGLRKLYFGFEQANTQSRSLLGKADTGHPLSILQACEKIGIKCHLFCMVGYPGTSSEDAQTTVSFLLEHQALIDTADLVGFQLPLNKTVPGIELIPTTCSDWALQVPYKPSMPGVLSSQQVAELEIACHELLWDKVPRLLHPLYRLVGHWEETKIENKPGTVSIGGQPCSHNSCSMD